MTTEPINTIIGASQLFACKFSPPSICASTDKCIPFIYRKLITIMLNYARRDLLSAIVRLLHAHATKGRRCESKPKGSTVCTMRDRADIRIHSIQVTVRKHIWNGEVGAGAESNESCDCIESLHQLQVWRLQTRTVT